MDYHPTVSDEEVLRATGRSLREWFGLLGSASWHGSSREELLSFLREAHGLPPLWQQCIATEFERSLGLGRESDEGCLLDVSFEICLPAERVFAAWADPRERAKWLRRSDFEPSEVAPPTRVRGKWSRDGSDLEARVEATESGGCLLSIHQRRLADTKAAEGMRRFWKTAVERILSKFS